MVGELPGRRSRGSGRLGLHPRRQDGDPFVERVELPARVTRLGDPVGVEQKLIVGVERVHLLRPGIVAERDQAERRCRGADLQHGDARVLRNQDGRRMTAVEDGQPALVRVDLRQQGGDELLVLAPAPRQARVEAVRDLVERVHAVRELAEPADDVRGDLDRFKPLAAHIADDQPDAVLAGGGDLVQVAAHPRLRGGGEVDDADGQRADHLGERPEHGALGGLRNRGDVDDLLGLLLLLGCFVIGADPRPDHADHGDHDGAADGRQREFVRAVGDGDAALDRRVDDEAGDEGGDAVGQRPLDGGGADAGQGGRDGEQGGELQRRGPGFCQPDAPRRRSPP